ncbi:MAG: hypothetical protein OEY14_07280 [Myxococcales bacterium]|nr:hypothetical protein [Myxococcales bacterium]
MTTRWILALVCGQALARTFTTLLGAVIHGPMAPPDAETSILLLSAAMLVAGALEGTVVGSAERLALGHRIPWTWIPLSAAAFALAWGAGMLSTGAEPSAPGVGAVVLYAALAGLVLGLLKGSLQTLALRGRPERPPWIRLNMLAWGSGMMIGAVVTDFVQVGPFSAEVLLLEILSGASTGLVVSLITLPGLPIEAPGEAEFD